MRKNSLTMNAGYWTNGRPRMNAIGRCMPLLAGKRYWRNRCGCVKRLTGRGDYRMFMSRRKSWRRRKLLYRSLRYAALFILLLSGATVWWVNSSRTDDLEQGSRLTDTRHRALLTLAGGEQIVLSQNDTLTVPVLSQKGANIEIRENQITFSTVSAVNDNIPCNTLTTPRGREYLLTLSDSTGCSSTKFTAALSGAIYRGTTHRFT